MRYVKIFICLVSLVLVVSDVVAQEGVNKSIGCLKGNVPAVVEINQPFNMDIWFEPSDPKWTKAIYVYMQQTQDMLYDPRVFRLEPGKKKSVQAQVVRSRSGLAVVRASSPGCPDLEVSLNAGFHLQLSTPKLEMPIGGGEIRSFSIEFSDPSGKAVPLDATVDLYVRASNAELRTKNGGWSNELLVSSEIGRDASAILQLQPARMWGAKGMVHVEARINKNQLLRSENIEFTMLPSRLFLLLMAIAGGMLYGLYLVGKEIAGVYSPVRWFFTKGILRVLGGAAAGSVSYFLVDWNILGLKVDTTMARGFVILGFLFSYVVIDIILKKITEGKKIP
jgi:hypothetical protein